jgi:peptide deformylase
VVVNPQILSQDGEEEGEEGCLSFPGIFVNVKRPSRIRLRFQDETGAVKEMELQGFIARVFLHEIDHLKGRLLIDHLSPIRRQMIKTRLAKRSEDR